MSLSPQVITYSMNIINIFIFFTVVSILYHLAKRLSRRAKKERIEYITLCRQIEDILKNIDRLKIEAEKADNPANTMKTTKSRHDIRKKIDFILADMKKAKESISKGNLEEARKIIEESNRMIEGAQIERRSETRSTSKISQPTTQTTGIR